MNRDRDIPVLKSVARYDTLTRDQISRLHFPGDDDGRITRKRLNVLHKLGLVNRTRMLTVSPDVDGGVGAPVYYPSAKGSEFLANVTGENTYRLCNTTTPNHLYLYHFVAVAETHMMIDRACAILGDVFIADWAGERSLTDPKESEAEKRYRLYARFDKIACVPDAGFLLQKGDFAKVFYLEQDRDTTKSAERVAAQKCQGYAKLAEHQVHLKKHFPTATWKNFNVLMVAPTPTRRDNLWKAVRAKPGGGMWKFASLTDLTPETVLTEPVWYQGDGSEPSALLRREASS